MCFDWLIFLVNNFSDDQQWIWRQADAFRPTLYTVVSSRRKVTMHGEGAVRTQRPEMTAERAGKCMYDDRRWRRRPSTTTVWLMLNGSVSWGQNYIRTNRRKRFRSSRAASETHFWRLFKFSLICSSRLLGPVARDSARPIWYITSSYKKWRHM